ncbi:protein of unknown function [Desulforhopalus singaporensis]|uniref:DUF748 domain-containing protein n=1 Tax=Desulforhopalus singaporensis TaxID=91360 RepID=A0A1H0UIH2_9BACT|nr:protein of unknown function [Desulforhopalus singaporensis]
MTGNPFFRKKWVHIGAGCIVICLLLAVLVPVAAKIYLADWLEKNGADNATVESLWFNPFTGRLTVGAVVSQSHGRSLLQQNELMLDLSLVDLFHRNIRLESGSYSGLVLDVEQYRDGAWRFGTYTVGGRDKGDRGDEGGKTGQVAQTPGEPWGFLADNVVLTDCRLHLKSDQLDFELIIDEARIRGISTREGALPGSFFLRGTLDGEPLEFDLDVVTIAPYLDIGGKVAIKRFKLAEIAAFLEESLPVFDGDVSVIGKAEVTMKESGLVAHYDGAIDLQSARIGSDDFVTGATSMGWQGQVNFDDSSTSGMTIVTDGTLKTGDYMFSMPGGQLKIEEELIELGGKTRVVLRDGVTVTNDGSLVIANGSFASPGLAVTQENFQWQGKLSYALSDQKEGHDIKGEGRLLIDDLSLHQNQQTPLLAISKVEIDGLQGTGENNVAAKSFVAERIQLTVQGDMPLDVSVPVLELSQVFAGEFGRSAHADSLQVQNPRIVSRQNGEELVNVGGISVQSVALENGTNVSVKEADFVDLAFLGGGHNGEEQPGLSFTLATLAGIDWSVAGGFGCSKLLVNDLVASVIKSSDGTLEINRRLEAMKKTAPAAADEQEEGEGERSAAPPFVLGEVVVGGTSVLYFEDKTLAVPFKTDLALKEFTVTGIDSASPDEKTKFSVKALLENRAPVDLTGELQPFTAPLALSLSLGLKNYPLESISPYTVQSVGTALASGQLQLDTNVHLEDGYLKMKNKVTLKKLETKRISEKQAQELDNQLPIPLDAALSVLRDKDRNIELNIPLNGPVSDLSVGVADVVITALGKAIVPAASGYLMYALGPYGALAYVGMKVGENVLKVDFPPVQFDPGAVSITGQHEDYLKRIATILQNRPETDLQLCPQVASWEFMDTDEVANAETEEIEPPEEQLEQLIGLGQQRGEAVQRHFVEDYGIAADRLLICTTQVNKKKKAVPAVLLQL